VDKKTYKNYYGEIDLNITNNSHTQAFIFLKDYYSNNCKNSIKVLEVGCSNGYFSAVLREHGIYVYGIEPFSDEAMTNKRVDNFFYGTVEEFCKKNDKNLYSSFDAIIFGDVLEHINSPKETIISISKFLKEEGIIIASVPNITHIGIRSMINDGMWNYQKYGILDSTHIHFFSWYNLKKMFFDAGFTIKRRYNVLVPEFNVYPSVKSYSELCLGKELNVNDHTFQYVVMASRTYFNSNNCIEYMPKNIIIFSPDPLSSLTTIRLIKPLYEYASKYSANIKIFNFLQCNTSQLEWADVIILHREINVYEYEFIKLAQKRGIPIIYDIDDLLFQIPDWSANKIDQTTKELIKNTMSIVDKVTCTTQPLYNELKKISDNICIIKNVCIPSEKISNPKLKHFNEECTLVVSSSDRVIVEFLIPSIQTILNIFNHIKLVVIGNISYRFRINKNQKNIKFYAQCNENEYSKILNSINNGIGLIPLDKSLFSQCKSSIKFFHYTTCGIVTIASNVKPYSDTIINNKTGILVDNDPKLWCDAISETILNYRQRQLFLENAIMSWKDVASKNIAVEAWETLFSTLPRKDYFV